MSDHKKNKSSITLDFPSDLEYIPAVRRLVSDLTEVKGFSPKYAFRTEIICDELCNNAAKFGSVELGSRINIRCDLQDDHIHLVISDEGGREEDIKRLEEAVSSACEKKEDDDSTYSMRGRGLEMVNMLSSEVKCKFSKKGNTEIRVVKYREDINENIPDEAQV